MHNQGTAIPPAVQEAIFEPLARYTPTERGSATSIGLGLFIARAIVAGHGGTITVSSTDGDGTTFSVRLPRREPHGRGVADGAAHDSAGTPVGAS